MNIYPITLYLSSKGLHMCPTKVSLKFTCSVSITFSKPTLPMRRNDVCSVWIILNKLMHILSSSVSPQTMLLPTGLQLYDASTCSFRVLDQPSSMFVEIIVISDIFSFPISKPFVYCHTFSMTFNDLCASY